MSRKHYKAIAAALAATRPTIEQHTRTSAVGNNTMVNHISFDAARVAWTATRDAMADVLASNGYLFDRERFVAATEA